MEKRPSQARVGKKRSARKCMVRNACGAANPPHPGQVMTTQHMGRVDITFGAKIATVRRLVGASQRMKTIRVVLVTAFACSVAFACLDVAAEEIKYLSPDGRFALRITQPANDEYHPTVELIEKDSDKVMVTLHSGSDTDLFDPSECVLVWSADSKSVAYGFRATPPGVREVEHGVLVCFWDGSEFDKVFLPENLPTPKIKFAKGKGADVKPYGGGVTPVKWLTSRELEMSSENMVLSEDDNKSYTGVLSFTISFDAQNHPSVKKIGKTKTKVGE